MSVSTQMFLLNILSIIFDAAILGATFYAVFSLDRSGWWFALAVFLIGARWEARSKSS